MKICIMMLIMSSSSLKIYRSTLPISSNSGVSGLKYINEQNKNINFNEGFTVCARFNYKKLSWKSWLFDFDQKGKTKSFLWFKISYPNTWFGLGNFGGGGKKYGSWLLKDPETKNFNIWYANRWHHVCIAFEAKSSHIALIKVSVYIKSTFLEQTEIWKDLCLLISQFFGLMFWTLAKFSHYIKL